MASMVLELLHQMASQLHEVVLNDTYHMEAIGYDSSIGKIASNQAAVRAREIDADDLHELSTIEFFEE